jgi:uncharacterized alpha-E superfamily protein
LLTHLKAVEVKTHGFLTTESYKMLSRVAENIYWMARYIERAENTARLVLVNSNLLLDLPQTMQPGWQPIIEILGLEADYQEHYDNYDERSVLKYIVAESPENSNSIVNALRLARENARTIREVIPREAWERINDLYLTAKSSSVSGYSKKGRFDYMQKIIVGAQTITGLLSGTMLHNNGYDFLKAGRNLERADMTTRIIDVRSADLLPEHEQLTPYDNIQWMSVLKSLSAYQMYRLKTQERVSRHYVLQFLLKEKQFPRSFYHTLLEVKGCLNNLSRNKDSLLTLNKMVNKVKDVDPSSLLQNDLHLFIDELQVGIANLNEVISTTYFE